MKYRYTVQQLKKMEQCRYLTDRERRVFNLVCRRGWAIEDAAAELYLSRSSIAYLLLLRGASGNQPSPPSFLSP